MTDKKLMTADEILTIHLKEMLNKHSRSYTTIEEMKAQPEWETCVKAMQTYAKYLFENVVPKKKKRVRNKGSYLDKTKGMLVFKQSDKGFNSCIDQIKENLEGLV